MMYCLHMGHSASCLPHFVHVTMWPHSRSTQSMGESIQILQVLSSALSAEDSVHVKKWILTILGSLQRFLRRIKGLGGGVKGTGHLW